ncbi:hypothetical protein [Pyxidicoccus xibeiensis]|uniref:hypothetical protein n=1 Tax=Pyxidicoccus xibeiensis TaxID=2906759 RepID=UPI0020A79B9E|nr:hypothetical protein [Pyxidicoccus xibeiensis]MCP3143028.1 hypothetical protein [Pyxidicoccus xibeiensis]
MAAILLGLSACGGADEASTDETRVDALVSSESRLTCTTCGTTSYSTTQGAQGYTCSVARGAANGYVDEAILWDCPAGACNVKRTFGTCTPIGPSRTDGFESYVSATYSCCQ